MLYLDKELFELREEKDMNDRYSANEIECVGIGNKKVIFNQ